MNVVVVAWCQFQARTTALARELGTNAHYINDAPLGRSLPLTPLRYLARGVHMWRLLQRTKPRTLIVITAPVFAPLVGWLWCALHRRQLVVDCHPGVLHFRRWRWALAIHRRIFRHARLVLVHTPDDERLVNGWGAPALFLPDDLARASQAVPVPRRTKPSIVVAGTFDPDEPISALLAAAALVLDIELRLTGDAERLPAALRLSAPKNVTFLGYLAYDRFLGEMLAADAVAVFTTNQHVMSRAGQDAIGLGRPLVSSDRPWLRSRFAETAVLCENEPEAIAKALREALRQQASLAQRSRERALTLRAWRDHGLEQLKLAVSPLSLPSPRGVLRTVIRRIPDLGLMRASAIVLAGDSFARLLGFLFVVAAARLLTPAGYGRISYALAVAAIVSVLTVNSPFGLSRFLARHQGDRRTLDLYATNWLLVIALMLAASLTLLVPVALFAGLGGAMFFALTANLLGTAVLQTYRESQKALSRFWATSLFWALANLLELIAILIAAALGWRSPALFLTFYGLSSVWALVIMQPFAPTRLRFVRALVSRRQLLAIARFSSPLILQGILYNIWIGADLILVQHFRHASVGNYAAAKTLALALMVPAAAIATALAPRMARLEEHQIRRYLAYVIGLTAAVSLPAAGAMALFGTTLIGTIFGSRYLLAGTVLPVLILGQVFYGLYLVLASSWAWGLGRPHIDPVATGAAMVVTVGLGLVLVPSVGLVGAAIAYAAGSAAQFAVIAGFTVWAIFAGSRPRLGQARELVAHA